MPKKRFAGSDPPSTLSDPESRQLKAIRSMKRRQFVTGLAAAAGVSACAQDGAESTTAAVSQETFEWNMVTAWPPGLPGLGIGVQNLAKAGRYSLVSDDPFKLANRQHAVTDRIEPLGGVDKPDRNRVSG